jgi:hypothetical protein
MLTWLPANGDALKRLIRHSPFKWAFLVHHHLQVTKSTSLKNIWCLKPNVTSSNLKTKTKKKNLKKRRILQHMAHWRWLGYLQMVMHQKSSFKKDPPLKRARMHHCAGNHDLVYVLVLQFLNTCSMKKMKQETAGSKTSWVSAQRAQIFVQKV